MEFRNLKEEELQEWFDLCGKLFGIGEKYFRMHYFNDPWSKRDGIFICEDQGCLVGSVRVFFRKVYINGQVVPMGGIGEVCTDKEYRGKGIASRLLKMAIAFMEADGLEVSVLGSGADGLYESFGWRGQALKRIKCSVEKGSSELVLFEPKIHDLETFSKLYKNFSSDLNGPIVRDANDYWKDWFYYEACRRDYFKGIKLDGEIIGYIVIKRKKDEFYIDECILKKNKVDYFDGLLSTVLNDLDIERANFIFSSIFETNYEVIERMEDYTWMYKSIGKSQVFNSDEFKMKAHVLWGIDDF